MFSMEPAPFGHIILSGVTKNKRGEQRTLEGILGVSHSGVLFLTNVVKRPDAVWS